MDRESKDKPQNYLKEILFILAVTFAGIALQFVIGPFGFSILAFPVNLVFLLIFLLIMSVRPTSLIGRFGTLRISIILISLLIFLTIVMGLVPGNTVKSSWPFVLAYLMLLTNLALVIGRKLRDISFLLNHLGLFVLLFAAGFGSADIERYFMKVEEGDVEWRGTDTASGKIAELPVAVRLIDFNMEEYPAKLALIDRNSGQPLPEEKPEYVDVHLNSKFRLGEWRIEIDSVVYRKMVAPAAFIVALNGKTGEECKGWVSCGNYFQPHKVLEINDEYCVAMTYPDPKSFSSKVEVLKKGGSSRDGVITVNHPMTVGQWKIYQYSYNTQMGRDSDYSIFELVYDPWLIPAYIGIAMLFAGAVTLFWRGGRR